MSSATCPAETPLAIIGMACRLPGADNLAQFWRLLMEGGSAVREMPPELLDQQLYYDPEVGARGKTYSKLAAMLNSREFDRTACPIDARLADSVDNAHRLMCQTAADALRHAQLDPFAIPLRNTGVFVGHAQGSGLGGDYTYATCVEEAAHFLEEVPALQALPPAERVAVIGELIAEVRGRLPRRTADAPDVSASLVAGIISKAFGLTGPYLAINSACASSLQAILLGARALQLGRVDMAIVGGASDCKSDSLVLFSAARAMSATGSRPFDADADGLICGEGYGALVLKTLDRALADGDPVHAVIRGLGVSSDGKGKSLWAPRKEGQMLAMERAYAHGLDMSRLEYLEAHSTATQLGDATELNTLTEMLRPILPSGKRVPITSVKANIGHTLETAGIAGVIKTVLCMHHETIPPAINIQRLNPKIDWDTAPVYVPQKPVAWKRRADGMPRRAGVNAFGIGGLNMHVVLDEFLPSARYTDRETLNRLSATGHATTVNRLPQSGETQPIAVIGLGCVLPGALDVASYWDLLSSGRDPKQPTPPDRWRTDLALVPGSREAYRTPTTLGGYITDFRYDWRRHKVPPKQIEQADPLQFMLLDAADQAMRDAGYTEKPFDRARVGVVVGTEFGGDFAFQLQMGLRLPEMQQHLARSLAQRGWSSEQCAVAGDQFAEVLLKHWPALIDETGSFSTSSLASRIAKTWNLMGGAAAIDAGETAGHAVLATSIDMLLAGDCDMMICAAGQRRMSLPEYETLAINGVLAPVAPYNPFDAHAQGYVPGEGVVVLLLKRLTDAERDGDHVHAVVHSIGAGHSASWGDALHLATARALEQTRWRLSDIGLLELDALGSQEATRDELRALVANLREESRRRPMLLSTALGQIGNTQGASGLVSLLKAILQMRSGLVPAMIGLETLPPELSRAPELIEPAVKTTPLRLTTTDGRRLAAVASCARGLSFQVVLEHGERVPVDTVVAESMPAAQPQLDSAMTDTSQLEEFLINFVVEQTGYPPEVVELDADLEADLGIDSIKKAQLFGELQEYFDITPTEDLTLDDFPTLRHVLNFLAKAEGAAPCESKAAHDGEHIYVDPSEVTSAPSIAGVSAAASPLPRALLETADMRSSNSQLAVSAVDLETFLINFVVEQTGYPPEVVELDADLEADLGIDSIKKAQLFGELQEYFDITPTDDLTLDDFPTLRHVLNFLAKAGNPAPVTSAQAAVAAAVTPGRAESLTSASPSMAAASSRSAPRTSVVDELTTARPVTDAIDLETFLINFVVEQTGYPPEVVEIDADLEADLGIDSIKKAQLFGELQEYFDITPTDDLTLDDFPTLRHVLNFLARADASAPVATIDDDAAQATALPAPPHAREPVDNPAPLSSAKPRVNAIESTATAAPVESWNILRLGGGSVAELKSKLQGLEYDSALHKEQRAPFVPTDAWRLAMVVGDTASFAARKKLALAQLENPTSRAMLENQGIFCRALPAQRPRVAFLFPGQGSQYAGMLRPLVDQDTNARQALLAINNTLAEFGYPSFEQIAWDNPSELGKDVWTTQIAMLIADALVYAALTGEGIQPDLVAGHSYGEYVALLASGAWDFAEALRVTRARCDGIEACSAARGGMLATSAPLDVLEAEIRNLTTPVYLANLNAPDQTVVGGPTAALNTLARRLEQLSHSARMLAVPAPFHTPLMSDSTAPIRRALDSTVLRSPQCTMYSIVTNAPVREPSEIRANLVAHLTTPVRYQALVEQLVNELPTVLIEVGPQQALTRLNRRILGEAKAEAVACDQPRRSPLEQLACVRALLDCLGVTDRPPVVTSPVRAVATTATQAAASAVTPPTQPPERGRILRYDATERRREKMRKAAQGLPEKRSSNAPHAPTSSPQLAAAADLALPSSPPSTLPSRSERDERSTTAHAPHISPVAPAKIIRPGIVASSPAPTTRSVPSSARAPSHGNGSGKTARKPVAPMSERADTPGSAAATMAGRIFTARSENPSPVAHGDERIIAPVNLVQLHGSPYEMGFQHGTEQQESIRAALLRLADITDAQWEELVPAPDLLAQPERVFDVEQLAELEGIAAAVGVPRENLVAYNMILLADCGQHCGHLVVRSEDPRRPGWRHGLGETPGVASKLGECLVPLVQLRQPTTGIAHVTIGFAGCIGLLGGLNAAGLAVTSSLLLDQLSSPTRPLRMAQRVRNLLSTCTDIASATALLQSARSGDGNWSLLVSHAADEHACSIECVGDSLRFRSHTRQVLAANHSQLHASHTAPVARSRARLDRMQEHLPPTSGAATEENVWQALHAAAEAPFLGFVIEPRTGELAIRYALDAVHVTEPAQRMEVGTLLRMTAPSPILPHTSEHAIDDRLENPSIGQNEAGAELEDVEFTADESRTSQRFCLRTVAAPLTAEVNAPTGPGAALVVGQNVLADAVAQRLRSRGITVERLYDLAQRDEAAAALTVYWQRAPITNLFLLSAWDQPKPDLSDYRQWQEHYLRFARAPLAFCQEWVRKVVDARLLDHCRVMALTDLGGDLGFQSNAIAPASGAMTGLMKALCLEYYAMRNATGFRSKAIDAPRSEPVDVLADQLLQEWDAGTVDYEVVYRDGKRHLQVAVPADAQPKSAVPIRRGAVWIVTGGARGITAHCARELGRRFGLKLHLIGTTPRPELDASWLDLSPNELEARRSEWILRARERGEKPHHVLAQFEKDLEIARNLEAFADAGIVVTYHQCDVGDRASLDAVLAAIRQMDGPIEGILHGAGIERSSRFEKKSADTIQATFAAKVEGAYNLMHLTRKDPVRHYIGFGSISGRLGSNGQADYCAASDMLCKLIGWYRTQRPECHAIAFHWHPWDDAGMAYRPETRAMLEMTNGPRLMAKTTGLKHLVRELLAGSADTEILITDWEYHQRYYPKELRAEWDSRQADKTRQEEAPVPVANGARERIARRYVMQTRPSPAQRPEVAQLARLGSVLVFGDNPDARAVVQRLAAAGLRARILSAERDVESILGEFEELWREEPALHLVIMTGRDPAIRGAQTCDKLAATIEETVYAPYLLTQRWFQRVSERPRSEPATLLAATALGGQFGFHGAVEAPAGGALAGLLKSVYVEDARFEHKNFRVKVIDFPAGESSDDVAQGTASELGNRDPEVEVAWSRGKRTVVTCVPADTPPIARDAVPRGGTWIVTGGARGITAATALELGRRYGLKLHLIGRSPAPRPEAPWHHCSEEKLKEIKRAIVREEVAAGRSPEDAWDRVRKDREILAMLEQFAAAGVNATYHSCDVADRAALARVLDEVRRAHGPIEGVLHGAGYAKAGRFETRSRERMERTLAPKVAGTLALMSLTQRDPLKYFITFGSLSGRFGGNGLSDYAAANDMLAKLGGWFRTQRPDCRTTCFHWQTWDRIGMAMLADGVGITKNAFKMDFLPPEEGVAHVIDELKAGLPEREVLITDGYFEQVFYPKPVLVTDTRNHASRKPLIESYQAAGTGPALARVVFQPATDPFLVHHRLRDKPFLPGVIGIETVLEAASIVGGTDAQEIREVEIVNGLQFHSEEPITCQVEVESTSQGLHCTLTSEQRDRRGRMIDARRVHVRGVVPNAGSDGPLSADRPSEPPLGWTTHEYPEAALLSHGPPLRALAAVAYQYDGGWGKIIAPELAELAGPRSAADWVLPPAVLDACVVCCGTFLYVQFGGVLEVPHGFQRLRWTRQPKPGEICILRIYFRSREPQHSTFDFTLYGEDRVPILQAEGYRTIRVGGGRAE